MIHIAEDKAHRVVKAWNFGSYPLNKKRFGVKRPLRDVQTG